MKFSSPAPAERSAILQRQQQMKMARSAHAYVRGKTVRFYDWLDSAKSRIPSGPEIWICGDCHVGNLGPVADSKGRVEIEIRDLDQTVIGNPAHDLIRLALSLSMASRSSNLPGVTTALMMERMMDGYAAAMAGGTRKHEEAGHRGESIKVVLKDALNRKWRHLATERIEDVRPEIPLGKKFWGISKGEKKAIAELFETDAVRSLITCLRGRDKDDKVEVLDAAYWMKGCSSLGRYRYAVLVGVGKSYSLIDMKEATKAAAPASAKAEMPADQAERIVTGARALSPYLGGRMLPINFMGKTGVMRELRPQDLKFELDRITQDDAVASSGLLAGVVGRAHARQMTPAVRKAWLKNLKDSHGQKLDAPSWLWTSLLELVAAHESEYLEHCRRYALAAGKQTT